MDGLGFPLKFRKFISKTSSLHNFSQFAISANAMRNAFCMRPMWEERRKRKKHAQNTPRSDLNRKPHANKRNDLQKQAKLFHIVRIHINKIQFQNYSFELRGILHGRLYFHHIIIGIVNRRTILSAVATTISKTFLFIHTGISNSIQSNETARCIHYMCIYVRKTHTHTYILCNTLNIFTR